MIQTRKLELIGSRTSRTQHLSYLSFSWRLPVGKHTWRSLPYLKKTFLNVLNVLGTLDGRWANSAYFWAKFYPILLTIEWPINRKCTHTHTHMFWSYLLARLLPMLYLIFTVFVLLSSVMRQNNVLRLLWKIGDRHPNRRRTGLDVSHTLQPKRNREASDVMWRTFSLIRRGLIWSGQKLYLCSGLDAVIWVKAVVKIDLTHTLSHTQM